MLPHGTYLQPANFSTQSLDALAHSSQYALQQLQHSPVTPHHAYAIDPSLNRHRRHPYNTGATSPASNEPRDTVLKTRSSSSNGGSAPIRRRISRACDQCNQLRTKCDGKTPCAHCVEFNLACEYARERKKRGKASRKEIAQQQAAAGATPGLSPASPNGLSPDSLSPIQSSGTQGKLSGYLSTNEAGQRPVSTPRSMSLGSNLSGSTGFLSNDGIISRATSLGNLQEASHHPPTHTHHHQQLPQHQTYPQNSGILNNQLVSQTLQSRDNGSELAPPSFCSLQDYGGLSLPSAESKSHLNEQRIEPDVCQKSLSGKLGNGEIVHHFDKDSYPGLSTHPQQALNGGLRVGTSSQSPLSGVSEVSTGGGLPGWASTPTSLDVTFGTQQQYRHHNSNLIQPPRYPVLQPLIPHMGHILPISLACDLLDSYFVSSSSAPTRPLSPYVLGNVFRRRSFLHPSKPRKCSPALLASMLWVAAQTCEAAFLSSPPSARGAICQKLMELTVGLLKPLVHGSIESESGIGLSGLPDTLNNGDKFGTTTVTGSLDDVATYINLATVISASEYKAASLRWWNAAWSLARELKLGRELPTITLPNLYIGPLGYSHISRFDDYHASVELIENGSRPAAEAHFEESTSFSKQCNEEAREERRRIWWLLYIVDRHLALCYNRPLFLLDLECDSLLQPIDDNVWQADDEFEDIFGHFFANPEIFQSRRRGPTFECTGHSIFGYFLPLMTILGEIVDFNHARKHPRFGHGFKSADEWDSQASEIVQQLAVYGRSLREFEARWIGSSSNNLVRNDGLDYSDVPVMSARSAVMVSCSTETDFQTKVVVAYGTHVMHVLHVLLAGKWDPISLLDDNDLWTSSQSFVNATQHAISAAEAVSNILDYDPDLSFMPFFFGIYLLQDSFLLLLVADRFQDRASQDVEKACGTIVRAHEACVVTLNAEYQSNFRKVMRSALAQVRGLIQEGIEELRRRRREVLELYRWMGDGSGLAL